MKPNENEEAKRWLRQAQQDLEDARYNFAGGRFNVACFLSQQSAEKAIKGYLYYKGEEILWSHSVGELCKIAEGYASDFSQVKSKAASLDKYYTPEQYCN